MKIVTLKGKCNKVNLESNHEKQTLNYYTFNVATWHDACKQVKYNCNPNPPP